MSKGPSTAAPDAAHSTTPHRDRKHLLLLSLAALGIVYGDIATSPLYALRECFHGEYGIAPSQANILGVLSLMFWSLIIVVSLKYLTFVLRADNRGEGGVIALTSLIRSHLGGEVGRRWFLVGLGLFAAALLYGDSMITPAISVMSAVEGVRIIAPALKPYVIPVTLVILVGLFSLQKRGTTRVGSLFGPITLIWLISIGLAGLFGIINQPHILASINPLHGAYFLSHNHLHGFLVLGAVFLVVTGTEALYADMGHFGASPLRLTWYPLVFPALLLNYFGQGAVLLAHPEKAHHPFYALVPSPLLIPMVILATAATIIASQAVISGAFSLTRQAIQLGYLPRLRIVYTSALKIGQIYIPQINWLLMIATLLLVIGFQTSSRLAAAYGVAVSTTMLITTILFFVVARQRWGWRPLTAGLLAGFFLMVDIAFFAANISKIAHGAWFPLVIGAAVFILMTTWNTGRRHLAKQLEERTQPLDEFLRVLEERKPVRVPGKAVFLAGSLHGIPPALAHNLQHNKVLHAEVAILTIETQEIPRVPRSEKVALENLGFGIHRIVARFGFMESPSVPYVLALAREQGLHFQLEELSFFLGRERLLPRKKGGMPGWRTRLFAFMSRNAQGATAYFHIPPGQVIEIGEQVEV